MAARRAALPALVVLAWAWPACLPCAPTHPRPHGGPSAAPQNHALLWSTVWSEERESGVCTGIGQEDWMRTAVVLRETYLPDTTLAAAGIAGGSVTTGAAIGTALRMAFGKQPHVACSSKG